MRFIVMVMATKEPARPVQASSESFTAMQKYNEAAAKAGVLLAAEGLTPRSKGARVKFSGDTRTVVDGPFTEAKEVVAGFSIIKANSLDEAIEWVKGYPMFSPNGETEVEIRKLMDIEDFGEGFKPNPEIAKLKIK